MFVFLTICDSVRFGTLLRFRNSSTRRFDPASVESAGDETDDAAVSIPQAARDRGRGYDLGRLRRRARPGGVGGRPDRGGGCALESESDSSRIRDDNPAGDAGDDTGVDRSERERG